MNQKGFANIILVLIVVAVVGAGAYFVSTKQIRLTTPSPTQSGNTLSVVDLTDNKEVYLNKQVRVRGKVHVNVFYGEFPCREGDPVCDTSMGARLEFWQEQTVSGKENFILLFKSSVLYPCEKIAPAKYKCGTYTSGNDQLTTINGVWQKDREAIGWVGTTPTQWQDRYFLNIE